MLRTWLCNPMASVSTSPPKVTFAAWWCPLLCINTHLLVGAVQFASCGSLGRDVRGRAILFLTVLEGLWLRGGPHPCPIPPHPPFLSSSALLTRARPPPLGCSALSSAGNSGNRLRHGRERKPLWTKHLWSFVRSQRPAPSVHPGLIHYRPACSHLLTSEEKAGHCPMVASTSAVEISGMWPKA